MGEDNMTLGYLMGQESGNKNNGLFGGGDGWLGLILFAGILGGGFGGGGSLFGGGGSIQSAFTLNNIEGGIRGIQQGLCDGFYAVNTALLTGFNGLQSQISGCCCETQRNIDSVRYDMATGFCNLGNAISSQTRDIIDNQNANTRQIMDFMVNSKIESLQAENQSLKLAASQAQQNSYLAALSEAQTAELIRRINPTPVPSYTVPAPYPYCGSGYGYGYGGSGCGCGC